MKYAYAQCTHISSRIAHWFLEYVEGTNICCFVMWFGNAWQQDTMRPHMPPHGVFVLSLFLSIDKSSSFIVWKWKGTSMNGRKTDNIRHRVKLLQIIWWVVGGFFFFLFYSKFPTFSVWIDRESLAQTISGLCAWWNGFSIKHAWDSECSSISINTDELIKIFLIRRRLFGRHTKHDAHLFHASLLPKLIKF